MLYKTFIFNLLFPNPGKGHCEDEQCEHHPCCRRRSYRLEKNLFWTLMHLFFSRLQPEQRQPWLCGRRRRSTPRLKHNHVEQCKQMVTQDQLQEHRATMQFVQTKSVKHVELQQHWICSSFLPIQIQRQRKSLIFWFDRIFICPIVQSDRNWLQLSYFASFRCATTASPSDPLVIPYCFHASRN